jgi:ABC-2 type transport system permease protein
MRELIALFSPQWWTFKNRLFRSDWTSYVKSIFVLILGAGFWTVALHYLAIVLTRLQGMEGNVGNIIALKGLSLLLMFVFFLLIFSSLLSSINSLYLSNDLLTILSSPVSWDSIFLSKWLETTVKSSWMIVFAILPVFIAFGLFFNSPAGYYFFLLPILLLYVSIPAGLGVVVSIILMALVPAKRAKNIFIVLGILILGILFLLFRFLRPERFANPEWFANLTIFLSEMKLSVSVFLPSMWATETLTPFFDTHGGTPFFYMLLLLFTVCVLIVFGRWLFNAFYYKGFVKAQQSHGTWLATSEDLHGLKRSFSLKSLYARFLKIVCSCCKGYRAALVEKDITTFFRNVGQSSQVLLLLAIIVIYLFSIKALPVEWGTLLSLKLRYIISFLNIGLVGFVIAAVATRLVLPSVGNEGSAFWIIRVSPLSMRKFLWSKFNIAFFPLLILAQALIIISNLFLGVKAWFMALGIGTCFVLVASITGLAIGIGAYTARFSLEDRDKEQSGFQGAAYMLSAFTVIVITVLLEIIPGVSMFVKEISKTTLTLKGWTMFGLLFVAVLSFNAFVVRLSMRLGEKRLMALE